MIASRCRSMQGRRNAFVNRMGILIVTLVAIVGGSAGAGQPEETGAQRADQLKAAYLLNFVKFVEWPASVPANLLTVCFVGGQGVLDAFASGIENKVAAERHLVARNLSESESVAGCNVLYLDAAKRPNVARATHASESPILTVSDAKDFARGGGMIELFTQANRLRFSINTDSAQRAGLRISSNLLQLAAPVQQAQPP